MCTPGSCITPPPRGGAVRRPARDVAVDAVLVRERLDTVQAPGREPPRPDVPVAAGAGSRITASRTRRDCEVLTRERCCRQRRIASERPWEPGSDPGLSAGHDPVGAD